MTDAEDPGAGAKAWIELSGGKKVLLTSDCRIGRVAGNEIVNPDPRISRQNTVVSRQGTHFVLVDLGSTNGTFLNDARIFKPTRLKDGDVIVVGSERYTFCEPPDPVGLAAVEQESVLFLTQVAVGKTFCWMLLVVPPAGADAASAPWSAKMEQSLAGAGASVKRLLGASIFAHWRDGAASRERVRAFVLEFARESRPAGARLTAHYGAVRVGSSIDHTVENLLGADVSFAHQMPRAAARLDTGILFSEAAVKSLGLEPAARSLGPQTLEDIPGTHQLFAI